MKGLPLVVVLLVAILLNATCRRNTSSIAKLPASIAELPAEKTRSSLIVIDSVVTPFDTACHIDGPVITRADNREGEVRFTGRSSLYCIVYTEPDAIDYQLFGYVCNMPNEFKRSTLKVIFSGKYYHAYKHIKHPNIDGQPQLYLSLEKIRMKGA